MWLLVLWIVIAVVVGVAASHRRRSGFGWFLLALLISPLLGAVLLLLLGPSRAGMDECGACLGLVPREATRCRHCGIQFRTAGDAPQPSFAAEPDPAPYAAPRPGGSVALTRDGRRVELP